MARKTKNSNLSLEEKLEQALVSNWDEPYKLPDNWCWVKLGFIGKMGMGQTILTKELIEDGVPVYSASEEDKFLGYIDKEINKIKLSEGDIVIPARGTIGAVKYVSSQEASCTQTTMFFKPLNKSTGKFIYYCMLCNRSELFKYYGNAIPQITITNVSQKYIPFAPMLEQKRIVEQIESLFAKLDEAKEKAQEVIDGYETRKAAILHKAFSGELTAQWREEQGVSVNNWVCKKLGEIGTLERGRSKHRPRNDLRLFGGLYPFIQTGDVASAKVYIKEHHQTLSDFGLKQSRLFPAGTLCITIAANIGDVAILTYDCCFPDSVVGFTPNSCSISKFVYYMMSVLQKELEDNAPATAQKNINLKILNSIEINIPPVTEQTEIVQILDDLLEKEQTVKETAERVLEQIEEMKKSILSKAFRGELSTADPTDQPALELLKEILQQEN